MKKLPIGISTFKDIINENYLYVDKTEIAQTLIEEGRYYFLSRPRRFGKSLILDTLATIFEGEREIFKGLHIYDSGYKFENYPTIKINFNDGMCRTEEDLERRIFSILKENQRSLDVKCEENGDIALCFRELIYQAYTKHNKKVVILIDEYDKPILDNIEKTEVARMMRDILKGFYSVIKGADAFVKFVFITGVSKFSKVALFSGLNNLNDITLTKKYATICGYRQVDLERTFKKHLEGQDFEKIKEWYNGYKFLGEGVYNPFDILLFIENNFEYRNYWFATATPTFLIKLIEKNNYYLPDLENIIKDDMMLNSFDVDCIELETLMWQTGYLTISHTETVLDNTEYHLSVPNREVSQSLLGSIATYISKTEQPSAYTNRILKALLSADFDTFKKHLQALFASIAYNNFTGEVKLYEYEGYYVSLFYAYMRALGVTMIAEDVTNRGRIDMTLKLPNAIFIMEFKVEGRGSALEQIKSRKYYEKYEDDGRVIYLMGIEFSKEARNIELLEAEVKC